MVEKLEYIYKSSYFAGKRRLMPADPHRRSLLTQRAKPYNMLSFNPPMAKPFCLTYLARGERRGRGRGLPFTHCLFDLCLLFTSRAILSLPKYKLKLSIFVKCTRHVVLTLGCLRFLTDFSEM